MSQNANGACSIHAESTSRSGNQNEAGDKKAVDKPSSLMVGESIQRYQRPLTTGSRYLPALPANDKLHAGGQITRNPRCTAMESKSRSSWSRTCPRSRQNV